MNAIRPFSWRTTGSLCYFCEQSLWSLKRQGRRSGRTLASITTVATAETSPSAATAANVAKPLSTSYTRYPLNPTLGAPAIRPAPAAKSPARESASPPSLAEAPSTGVAATQGVRQEIAAQSAQPNAAAASERKQPATLTGKSGAKGHSRLRTPRRAAMRLTPAAVEQVQALLDGPEPKLLKVGVRNRGCSGLAYNLEYVEKPGAFDELVEQDGVKVLVDSKALFSIIGSEMDWVEDKLNQRFVFRNPNIKEQCGCGESFMV